MGTGPSTPRRIVTRLLVVLLLGAVVNVAVAWGCATWSPDTKAALEVVTDASEMEWGILIPSDFGSPERALTGSVLGLTQFMAMNRCKDGVTVQEDYKMGLPCRSLLIFEQLI